MHGRRRHHMHAMDISCAQMSHGGGRQKALFASSTKHRTVAWRLLSLSTQPATRSLWRRRVQGTTHIGARIADGTV
jgi:hypothetical protein